MEAILDKGKVPEKIRCMCVPCQTALETTLERAQKLTKEAPNSGTLNGLLLGAVVLAQGDEIALHGAEGREAFMNLCGFLFDKATQVREGR